MHVSLKNIVVPSIPLAVFLVGMCFVVWMSAYFGGCYSAYPTQNTTIAEVVESILIPFSILSNIICIAFTLLNAFLIAQINNRFTIIRTRTFLPILIFIMLMSCWNQTHTSLVANLGLTFFVLALFNFFTMSRDRKASEQAFMGSFLISLTSLLINPLIFIIPVCWIGFMMFQCFSLRTFLASVFGTLSPWILFMAVIYSQHPESDFSQIFNLKINIDLSLSTFSLSEIVYSASIGLIMIISVVGLYSITNSDAINTRNKLNFLLFLLISLFVLSFIFRNQFILFLPILALVYSMLISHPLTLKQNNFYGILFLVFCLINIAFVISKYFIF